MSYITKFLGLLSAFVAFKNESNENIVQRNSIDLNKVEEIQPIATYFIDEIENVKIVSTQGIN